MMKKKKLMDRRLRAEGAKFKKHVRWVKYSLNNFALDSTTPHKHITPCLSEIGEQGRKYLLKK